MARTAKGSLEGAITRCSPVLDSCKSILFAARGKMVKKKVAGASVSNYQSEYVHTQIPDSLLPFAPITVVVGHYGVGKTNFSLNLAFDAKRLGKQVSVIDLDIVNPYFRSSDYRDMLEEAGINIISPVFAGSTLDAPSLSGAIAPALERADENHLVIADVGGDDAGATALGRFKDSINVQYYRMLYVVNAYRNLSRSAEEAAQLLAEIEAKSGLCASGVVNNSHLKELTDTSTIENAQDFAERTATLANIPMLATALALPGDYSCGNGDKDKNGEKHKVSEVPTSLPLLSIPRVKNPYHVKVYVRTPWED